MSEFQSLMARAAVALKAGNREEARALLMQALEIDENNEDAWLWLAGAMEDPSEQRIALENVLFINPHNTRAQKGLDWLRQKSPALFNTPTPPLEQPQANLHTPITHQPANTGPTIALTEQAAPLFQASPQPVQSQSYYVPHAKNPTNATDDPQPCPRCGAAVPLAITRCPKCQLLLTEKVERRHVSTAPAKIAGIFGILYSLVVYIGIGILLLLMIAAVNTAISAELRPLKGTPQYESQLEMMNEMKNEQLQPVYIGTTVIILLGILGISASVATMRLRLWGYIVSWVFFLLNLLLSGYSVASSAVMITTLKRMSLPKTVESIVNLSVAITIILFFVNLVVVMALAFSSKIFTKQSVRLILPIEPTSDSEKHFNRGVRYQRRGFWYQAMREWEIAVEGRGEDATYRHALAMIYTKLNRPLDALRELDAALQIAPDDPGINQDRQAVAISLSQKGTVGTS